MEKLFGHGRNAAGHLLPGHGLGSSAPFGPELVTNGTFDTDVSGWSEALGATMEWASGQMRIVASASPGRPYQAFTAEINKSYRVTVNITSSVAIAGFRVTTESTGGPAGAIFSNTGLVTGSYSQDFTATATTLYVAGLVTATGATVLFDDFSIREIL